MHPTLQDKFVDAFPEMIAELKIDHCLVPVLKLFLEQLEKHGFSLAEILIALSFVIGDRNLKEASALVEEAAKYADPVLENNNSEEN